MIDDPHLPADATRTFERPTPGAAHTLSFDVNAAAADPRLGTAVGQYQLIERIGAGGYGTVYRARDVRLDRAVAIKLLHTAPDRAARERFNREARVLAGLEHAGIVPVHHAGDEAGLPYLVMALRPTSVARLIAASPGGLGTRQSLRIALEAAAGLAHAHAAGVVHGDIKPANLLVDASGSRAQWCDFGLAWLLDAGEAPRGLRGSAPYLAPELLEGAPATPRSDVFAFGAMLYEMLSGQPPFAGDTPEAVLEAVRRGAMVPLTGVPTRLAAVAERAMAADPAQRFADGAALHGALQAAGRGGIVRRVGARAAVAGFGAAAALVALALYVVGGALVGSGGAGAVALADAREHLDGGDYLRAARAYEAYLASHPGDGTAQYGLGYALLLQGRYDEAGAAFAATGREAWSLEGAAAVAQARNAPEAAQAVAAAAERAPQGYAAVLLATMDLYDGNLAAAVERLEGLDPSALGFDWQRGQYLQTLGQAYFKLGDFEKAQRSFEGAAQAAGGGPARLAQDYADLAQRQQDASRRAALGEQIARVRALIDGQPAAPPPDAWTSRPLRVWIPPAQAQGARAAKGSGLAGVLPAKLARALSRGNALAIEVVEREWIGDVLAEQELSRLSPQGGAVRLGQVLGARLVVQLEFATLFEREYLAVNLIDTETTRVHPAGEYAVTPGLDPEAWVADIVHGIIETAGTAYPVRGRLRMTPAGPRVDIGSAVGLRAGERLQVLPGPAPMPKLEGFAAVVSEPIETESASIAAEGFELPEIPAEGWWVQRIDAPKMDGGDHV